MFAIQTPVAIAIAVRSETGDASVAAKVRYTRLDGSHDEKLATLNSVHSFSDLLWEECPDGWQTPFRPAGKGDFFSWPLLTDLMPWQHSGAQVKRTWPICPDPQVLERRWAALLSSADQRTAFRETRDRTIGSTCSPILEDERPAKPIIELLDNAPAPPIRRYAYRSFDRQWILADCRLGDYLRPDLWRTHSHKQIYLTSLFSQPLASGPALTSCALIPDLDHFRGSYGAKAAMPLYRNASASEANLLPGILHLLGQAYGGIQLMPEDFVAYVYGVLAQPAFTARFHTELVARELRVPITKDAALFTQARDMGARLLWLHTYGERLVPEGERQGYVQRGAARCTKAVPDDLGGYPEDFEYDEVTRTLTVGEGEFAPVGPEVFSFEVSGHPVVQSWLKYRMKNGAGKKSSPLDKIRPERWTSQFTTELLELLWVLEKTVAGYPEQAELLEAIMLGECFDAEEIAAPPEWMRKSPKAGQQEQRLL